MFKSPIRKARNLDGRRASEGILSSIDAILTAESSHSIKSVDEIDDDEAEEIIEDGESSPAPPPAELAKRLQAPPMPSPGVFKKRKSLGRKSRRAQQMKNSKKMGGSLSAIESLLNHSTADEGGISSPPTLQQQSPPSTPSSSSKSKSKLKRKSSKKKMIQQALKESRKTLPPFQSDDDEEADDELVLVKDAAMPRRNSMGTLSEVATAGDTNSRRARRSLASSLHSGMKSSVRRDRSSGVETSSRRSKRTVDADGTSSRRSRRTLDAAGAADGSSSSSRRSRRTLDVDGSSSRRSRRTLDVDDGSGNSSRRSRRTLNTEGSVRSLKSSSKKKKNKKSTSKKNKRVSSESYTSNSTSVTADLDESWNSLVNNSQRGVGGDDQLLVSSSHHEQQDETEDDDETTEREDSFKLPLEEEPAAVHEEREYELPLKEEEEDEDAAGAGSASPKRGLTSPLYENINNSLHRFNSGASSSSDLDLSEEEEEDDLEKLVVVQEKKKELPRFLGNASLGDIDLILSSDDEDQPLVTPEESLPSITEEVARPSSRRSLTRNSSTSSHRRGLSCGPISRSSSGGGARGRPDQHDVALERQSSKRGFSASPERHANLMETMDMMERPLLSCMKGSRMKLLSVKLKNPHVYFNECLVITPIIPTYELATKKSDLWFRQKDFDKILNRSMAIALRVKEGKKTRKCVRGLEHFLKDKEERYAAWNAVLVEQEIQNLSGSHSDERISDLYLAASTTCRSEAHERAIEDYDAIVRYILED